MKAEELVHTLKGQRKTANGWLARCPAHDDRNASLSISEAQDGKILLTCHAGCDYNDICKSLGIRVNDLFQRDDAPTQSLDNGKFVAFYDYPDESGNLLFQVCRMEPKGFRQRRPATDDEITANQAFHPKTGDSLANGQGKLICPDGDGWVWSLQGVDRVVYQLPMILDAKKRGVQVFICEGEKDVNSLHDLGFVATCNPGGAGKWCNDFSNVMTGMDSVILPHKDDAGRKHASGIRTSLEKKAKSCTVVELPDRNGKAVNDATDWIKAGGTKEELETIVKNAPEWHLPTKDKRQETSPENGKKGGRRPAPPHADAAEDFVKSRARQSQLRWWRGNWYEFQTDSGWIEIPERVVEDRVITWLRDIAKYRAHATRHYVNSLVLNLRAFDLCGIPHEIDMPAWLAKDEATGHTRGITAENSMAFNGKVVDIWQCAEYFAAIRDDMPIPKPAGPDFFSLDFLSYDFDLDADAPQFHKYLNEVLPDDEQKAQLQRMFGLMLTDTCRYEIFFYLYGPTARNGKNTALNILRALVGKHNVCNVNVANLDERFQTWPLADSKVNVMGDMKTEIRHGELAKVEGIFKDLVSGGLVEYERKGRDKYTVPCRARFICAGNDLPSFVDKSDALWERMRIVHFSVQIEEEKRDPHLAEKIITNELAGVLQWALWGLADIIQEGRVRDTKQGLEIKNAHRLRCDREKLFFQEEGYCPCNGSLSARAVYDAYREWMTANNYHALSAGNFYKRVESTFPSVRYGTKKDTDGSTYKALIGLGYQSDQFPHPPM